MTVVSYVFQPARGVGDAFSDHRAAPDAWQRDLSAFAAPAPAAASRTLGFVTQALQRAEDDRRADPPPVPRPAPVLQRAVTSDVVQCSLDPDDSDELAEYLAREYWVNPETDPDVDFQNDVFAYLGQNYDSFEEAVAHIEDAIAAVAADLLDDDVDPLGHGYEAKVPEEDQEDAGIDDPTPLVDPYAHVAVPVTGDGGQQDIQALAARSVAFAGFRAMYAAIRGKTNPNSYKEPKERCMVALASLNRLVDPSPPMVAKAVALTNAFLNGNDKALWYRNQKGLANKRLLEAAELGLMNQVAASLELLAGTFIAKPLDDRRIPGAIHSQKAHDGRTYRMATSYEILTGRAGAAQGTDAGGMEASAYLTAKYGLLEKNQMVAGHLATKKVGGKGEIDNLSPWPSYDFNQAAVRTPESKVEAMMRNDEVVRYKATVAYGRTGNDGSSVPFQAADLALIGKALVVEIDKLKLKADGDGTRIADWEKDKTVYNKRLPISLASVVSGGNEDRNDYEELD